MISINGIQITEKRFPDNTLLLHIDESVADLPINIVVWKYENDAELFTLICLKRKLDEMFKLATLRMPYIPHARMDRVKPNSEDVFTLKYFCETINTLGFCSVYVLDPHSNVSSALIDRLGYCNHNSLTAEVVNRVKAQCDGDLLVFYPDEGACKRYSSTLNMPYCFGMKRRKWETGEILGLDVYGETDRINGADILIVDDISSYGGTFFHSAKKLKELGANKIFLFVTHCENSVLKGDLIKSGYIEKIYTADTIFTESHPLVEVIEDEYWLS